MTLSVKVLITFVIIFGACSLLVKINQDEDVFSESMYTVVCNIGFFSMIGILLSLIWVVWTV